VLTRRNSLLLLLCLLVAQLMTASRFSFTAEDQLDSLLQGLWQALAPATPYPVAFDLSSPLAFSQAQAEANLGSAPGTATGNSAPTSPMTTTARPSGMALSTTGKDTELETYPTKEVALLLYYIAERLPGRMRAYLVHAIYGYARECEFVVHRSLMLMRMIGLSPLLSRLGRV